MNRECGMVLGTALSFQGSRSEADQSVGSLDQHVLRTLELVKHPPSA